MPGIHFYLKFSSVLCELRYLVHVLRYLSCLVDHGVADCEFNALQVCVCARARAHVYFCVIHEDGFTGEV